MILFSRGRPPTSGNLSTPAEHWVSSSHFCRGHLYLWGKHIEIVSPILLQLLKTVNGGRLFSFLNVKLLLYKPVSLLNHFSEMGSFMKLTSYQYWKWNHKVWRWMKLDTTSQLTKQYFQWSHCSNGFAAFTEWRDLSFSRFLPNFDKGFSLHDDTFDVFSALTIGGRLI